MLPETFSGHLQKPAKEIVEMSKVKQMQEYYRSGSVLLAMLASMYNMMGTTGENEVTVPFLSNHCLHPFFLFFSTWK